MNTTQTDKMIARRASRLGTEAEARELLTELLNAHAGDNLAHALCYEQFATETQAYRFINNN